MSVNEAPAHSDIMCSARSFNKITKKKKIAVILPEAYLGGTFVGAKNIAMMLHKGSRLSGEPAEVVFSCRKDFYNFEEHFGELLDAGIKIYETSWEKITQKEIGFFKEFLPSNIECSSEEYMYPTSDGYSFLDCDLWILASDTTEVPLAPLKPYGVMVFDYIQRYIPTILRGVTEKQQEGILNTVRNASFILTTTPQTQNDAIQYAGVATDKVHLMPMEFSPPVFASNELNPIEKPFFMWVTNMSPHKNQLRAFSAIERYYSAENGQFDVVIVGAQTTELIKSTPTINTPYKASLIEKFQTSPVLKKRCHVLGYPSNELYFNYMRHAHFLWHPCLFDNGTYAALEAAYLGLPICSSDYIAMRFMDETFNLQSLFFDPYSIRDMSQKLKYMELNFHQRKAILPPKNSLERYTTSHLARGFWEKMREWI